LTRRINRRTPVLIPLVSRTPLAVLSVAALLLVAGAKAAPGQDLNDDGIPDLVFSNYYLGGIHSTDSYVHMSLPGGGYAPPIPLATHGASKSDIADLDGDGHLDIVFANYYDGSSSFVDSYVYWGAATNPYTTTTNLATAGAYDVDIADLDGDGDLDVAFASFYPAGEPSTIYLGDPTTPYASQIDLDFDEPRAADIEIRDLNGDGYQDVLLAKFYDDSGATYAVDSLIYWGAPTNPYTTTTAIPAPGSAGSAIADLDQDGHLDIVFASQYDGDYNTISAIHWGSGTNDYSSTTGLSTNGAVDVEAVDVDQDGFLDIVFAEYYDGSSYAIDSRIYWGAPVNPYLTYSSVPTKGAQGVAVADLNVDGHRDLVFAESYDGVASLTESTIYYGNATGRTFVSSATIPSQRALDVQVATGEVTTIDAVADIVLNPDHIPRLADSIQNSALIRGDGRINATLANAADGEVRVLDDQRILFDADGSSNLGEINLLGGTLEFSGNLDNGPDGFIGGRGTLIANGGISNSDPDSRMRFDDDTSVLGDVANLGSIAILGAAHLSFFDDIVQDGELQIGAGSHGIVFGDFSGSGGTTGPGVLEVAGTLNPGSSPASVPFGGDLVLAPTSLTRIEMAGAQVGSFDRLDVAGDVVLGGVLELALLDGYVPGDGTSFGIVQASSVVGEFAGLPNGALVGSLDGANFYVQYAPQQVTLTVPEPSVALMLATVGPALVPLWRRRRRLAAASSSRPQGLGPSASG
jgi:hypothetical protein